MKRCMLALDVQNHFNVPAGTVHHINQLAQSIPTIATVLVQGDSNHQNKRPAPANDNCLINAASVFTRSGFLIPQETLNWLKENGAEEVLLTGGHTDEAVLAAGFSLHDAGFTPIMIPMLCYGNDWYMHTVTNGIWAKSIGKVFESQSELQF